MKVVQDGRNRLVEIVAILILDPHNLHALLFVVLSVGRGERIEIARNGVGNVELLLLLDRRQRRRRRLAEAIGASVGADAVRGEPPEPFQERTGDASASCSGGGGDGCVENHQSRFCCCGRCFLLLLLLLLKRRQQGSGHVPSGCHAWRCCCCC